MVVPAHPGTVTVIVPDLPPGDYAVAVAHDVNKNHKVDRNILGMPKEQWGMSNNPHATIKAPPFSAAKFSLRGDQIVEVQIEAPEVHDERTKELLREYAKLHPADPREAIWAKV